MSAPVLLAGNHCGRYPCAGERSDYGVRDFYREYAGRGGVKGGTVKHHYGSGGSPEAEKAQQCKRPKGRRNNAVVERTG